MTEPVPTSANVTPPPVSLLQMMTGYWVSQAVYVAAKLGIADRLADGPASVDDLATTLGGRSDVPADVNADKVDCKYKNGILELHLPRTQEAQAKRIQVKP